MAIPSALLAWPVQFSATSYALRITTDVAGPEVLTFPATGSLVSGRNYWALDDGIADDDTHGGLGSLLTLLEETLETHSDIAAASVTLTDDLLVSIDLTLQNGATSFSILWTHATTTLDASGFTFGFDPTVDAISFTNTKTSGQIPRGLWRPRKFFTVDTRNQPGAMTARRGAFDGSMSGGRLAKKLHERTIGFSALSLALTLDHYAATAAPFGTLEQMTDDAFSRGRPIRVYEDETDRDSTVFGLYWGAIVHMPAKQRSGTSQRLFDAEIPLVSVVPVTSPGGDAFVFDPLYNDQDQPLYNDQDEPIYAGGP